MPLFATFLFPTLLLLSPQSLTMPSHHEAPVSRSGSSSRRQGPDWDVTSERYSEYYLSDNEMGQYDDYDNVLAHPRSPDHEDLSEYYTEDRRLNYYQPPEPPQLPQYGPLVPGSGEEIPEDWFADNFNMYETVTKKHHPAGTFRYSRYKQLISPNVHNPRAYNELLRGRIDRFNGNNYDGNQKAFYQENLSERNLVEAMKYVSQGGAVHALTRNHIYYCSSMTPEEMEEQMDTMPVLSYDRNSDAYIFGFLPVSHGQ